MFKDKMSLIFSLFVLWPIGCSKDADKECDCTYNEALPEPVQVLRKGSGFTAASYSFSLNLSNGEAEYERTESSKSEASCKGSLNVGEDLPLWKEAAKLLVCTKVLKGAISDGWIDSMILYFPDSQDLPAHLTRQQTGDWETLEIQESFVDSVEGKQQFDCGGQFSIDSLIKANVPCLGIE